MKFFLIPKYLFDPGGPNLSNIFLPNTPLATCTVVIFDPLPKPTNLHRRNER